MITRRRFLVSAIAATLPIVFSRRSVLADGDTCGPTGQTRGELNCAEPGDMTPTQAKPVRAWTREEGKACCFWSDVAPQNDPGAASGKSLGFERDLAPRYQTRQIGMFFNYKTLADGRLGTYTVQYSPFDPQGLGRFQGWRPWSKGDWSAIGLFGVGYVRTGKGQHGAVMDPGLYLFRAYDKNGRLVVETVCVVDPPGDVYPDEEQLNQMLGQ